MRIIKLLIIFFAFASTAMAQGLNDDFDSDSTKWFNKNHNLKETVVKGKRQHYSRKENPAVILMRKVIEHKKQTRLENRDYYQYNKYQKLTLAANNISDQKLQEKPFTKHKWLKDQVEYCNANGANILPLSVEETVTQMLYRKSPKSEKNIIIGQQSSGVNDLIQTGDILNTVLKDVFTDVNIYDDQIRLLQYPFTSPIGKGAISFYRYYISDTLKVDNDSVIHLRFFPNNQQDFGFMGDIYVMKDSTYQVKSCKLKIPKKSDVNFVDNMEIEQEFTMLPDSSWVLSKDEMLAELHFNKLIADFVVLRSTRLTDYSFSEPPKQLFKGKTKEVKEASAEMRDENFWKQYRKVELTKSESGMDNFIKGIENIQGFKYIVFGAKALIENFVETGNPSIIDIGPVNTMISNNFVDGYRLRVSGHTTANLNKHWFGDGYIARGIDTHKTYYKGILTYSLNEKDYLPREFPKRTISIESTYDIMSPTDKYMHTDKDNMFTAFKWARVDKMMFYNRQRATFEYETDYGLKATAELKTEENTPAGMMFFERLDGTMMNSMRTTELRAELHIAPGQTYINTKQRRLTINLDKPEFTISHTVGLKNFLGGDYSYNYSEARFFKRFWMASWGKIDCMLRGGIQWNKVPYLLLCMPETNLSYITQDYTFGIINNMEFLNDRFGSAIINWDLNGKIFNRIPLLKKLKWREFASIRCLWGGLSDKNNPYLASPSDQTLMAFPEGSYIMDTKRPYIECAFGVHNILKLVHVEWVHRCNYNYLPTSKKNGIRFMIRMTF